MDMQPLTILLSCIRSLIAEEGGSACTQGTPSLPAPANCFRKLSTSFRRLLISESLAGALEGDFGDFARKSVQGGSQKVEKQRE